MSTKRILYISPNGFIGGAEKVTLDLCLNHNKYIPILLLLNDGAIRDIAEQAEIKTFVLPFNLQLSNPISVIRTILYIRKLVKKEQIDILHGTMAYGQIIGGLSRSLLKNVKLVWFQHGPVGGLLDKIGSLFKNDLLLFNSHYIKEEHIKSCIKKPKLNLVLPLGIAPRKIDQELVKSIRDNEMGKKIILSVGRISSFKGIEYLIQAMSQISNPEDYSCYILGQANSPQDQLYEKELKGQIQNFQLENTFHFVGQTQNVGSYMEAADFLVHCPKGKEGFGLVVAEGMLHNLLVIGKSQGGTKELLIANKTGLVVEEGSEVQGIVDGLSLSADRSHMVKEANSFVREKYNVNQMISVIEDGYGSLYE